MELILARQLIEDETTEDEFQPGIDTDPREFEHKSVDYSSDKGPNDLVVSGPVIGGWGPGRYFQNRRQALRHYEDKYGENKVHLSHRQSHGRWSVVIKDKKNAS